MHAFLDIKMDKIMRIPYPPIVIEKLFQMLLMKFNP